MWELVEFKKNIDNLALPFYMENMARTIDNLGLDTSTNYAQGREDYDESFIKDSPTIPSQTRIDVTNPFRPSEFELLFGLSKKGILWSVPSPPPHFYASRRHLFVDQLVPSLGPPEVQDAQIERLDAVGNEEIEHCSNPTEADEIGKEKTAISSLLDTVRDFNGDLIEINARRIQYQKG